MALHWHKALHWKAISFWVMGFTIALGAFLLRSHELELRPIHGDEAVQGYLLGTMLEGKYAFNPQEYHGPLLHNLTAPLAWARGEARAGWQDLSLKTLRLTPALCTSLLCLAPLLLSPWLTRLGALSASFLLAVDTMLIYFGRHYIAEGLLVTCLTFSFVFGWRAARAYAQKSTSKKSAYIWAALCGLAIACAWGTKATFILQLTAALIALILLVCLALLNPRLRAYTHLMMKRWKRRKKQRKRKSQKMQGRKLGKDIFQSPPKAILLSFFGTLLFSWLIIYSQMGTNPQGIAQSISTYVTYAERAQGQGHEKPFSYYAKTLYGDPYWARPKPTDMAWGEYLQTMVKHPRLLWRDYWELELLAPKRLRPWQTEAPLALLACLGVIACWLPKIFWFAQKRPRPWLVSWFFLCAGLLLLIYSLIAYKTIWSVLAVQALLCFPAAIGFYWLAQWPLFLCKLKRPQTKTRQILRKILLVSLYILTLTPSAYVAINWRAQIIWQNYDAYRSVNPSNPWVYSQAPTAFTKLPQKLKELSKHPTILATKPATDSTPHLRVACLHQHTPWPLPWYFRNQQNSLVEIGYFTQVNEQKSLENREAFRSNFAALIAGNEHLEQMSNIAATNGYRQSLLVQYYQHAHLCLWIRDDLFHTKELPSTKAPTTSASSTNLKQTESNNQTQSQGKP